MNYNIIKYVVMLVLLLGLVAACSPAVPEDGRTAGEVMSAGRENVDTVTPTVEADDVEADVVAEEEEAGFSAVASVGEPLAVSKEEAEEAPAVDAEAAQETTAEPAVGTAETYNGLPVGYTAEGRPYIGNLDAPVVIEEFSDYQCPYCARFYNQTMGTLKENAVANGEAVLIFYDYPLSFHPQAGVAANAARCAGEQGAAAYWGMHDMLFDDPDAWGHNGANTVFKEFAAELELEAAPFAECVDSYRYEAQIEEDAALGSFNGVTGTPSFLVNGELLVGALPTQTFEQAIARALAGEAVVEEPELPAVEELDIPPFEMPEPAVLSGEYAAVIGDEDAPVTIVEFSDYQCPFCNRHFLETMPQIMAEMIETGRVRYAFKDFPLDQIHPEAREAAQAARCAGEQEMYWEMHDQLFSTQDQWSGQTDLGPIFTEYALELGMDGEAFGSCYESNSYADAIEADYQEGIALGVTGTPAFFINGYFISGARPYELFELMVDGIETDTLEELYREAYDQQVEAYRQQVAEERAQAERANTPIEVPIDTSPSIGNPDAPITIIEYTDFQCPYCGRHFAETFPQIKENYIDTGLVRYVFKDFPLSFHAQAQLASEAARCADDQEAFLAMHDLLFANQDNWSNDSARDIFIGYADQLNLDVAAFTSCLDSGKYTEIVQADLAEGSSVGVTGTPSFVINGQLVVGALPYSTFDQALQQILAEQNNSN